jgi:DNA-binding transcriptional MerR regulator
MPRLADMKLLLRPVLVDQYSGYRYYSPDQLDQARLVAWLRRAGLPLATIAEINGRPPAEIAAAVTAWVRVATRQAKPSSTRFARSNPRNPRATCSTRCPTRSRRRPRRCAAAESDPEFADSGSTLTAMLWSRSRLALVHIGDSRAYLLRDGGLFQITHDHSVVQSLIDAGRLTPEEAWSHPQRAMLLKSLGTAAETPDLSLHDAQAGDRYLLCSDGLPAVVPAADIRETLAAQETAPADVVQHLIELANAAGGPDNIACVAASCCYQAGDGGRRRRCDQLAHPPISFGPFLVLFVRFQGRKVMGSWPGGATREDRGEFGAENRDELPTIFSGPAASCCYQKGRDRRERRRLLLAVIGATARARGYGRSGVTASCCYQRRGGAAERRDGLGASCLAA